MCCSSFDLKGKERVSAGGEKKRFSCQYLSISRICSLPINSWALCGIRKKSFGLVVLSNASLVLYQVSLRLLHGLGEVVHGEF